MSESRICRICLDSNFQMHQISGSEVQYVFEKITNTQVQDDGTLYYVCYLCYWQLRKCQQLVIKSQKSEDLLKQVLVIHNELNLKSVCSVDRLSHGLVNSMKISKTESFQIPECHKNIKSEYPTQSNRFEVMIKDETEDDWTHTEQCREPDEKQNFIHNKAKCIENICGSQKNTFANENEPSKIVNSVMISQTELLKIPECQNIKSEDPRLSNVYEVMIKVEADDDGTHTTEEWREPDERQNFIKDKAKCIENISGIQNQTHIEEIELTKIECNEISKQVLVIDDKTYFICNDCGKMFRRKAFIIKHISKRNCRKVKSLKEKSTHTTEKRFKCEYCDYTCHHKCHLKKHTARIHTRKKVFACKDCDYKSTDRVYLKMHIRTHTGQKPYKCEYCDQTCMSASTLKYHIMSHTGEKPFHCQYCIYRTKTKDALTTHIRTHTGEKPFKCEYCEFTCTTSTGLKKHIRTHSRVKPYNCEYCHLTYETISGVEKHTRTHTGEKPYKCEYCNYTCTKAMYLKKHIKRLHVEEPNNTCSIEQTDS